MKLPYIQKYRDRHGTTRVYYRRKGRSRVPLPPDVGSPEFLAAYSDAAASFESPRPDTPNLGVPAQGTWRWLCVQYFKSEEFMQLSPDTRRSRRRILEATCLEPWTPGKVFADAPIMNMTARAIAVLRDRKAGAPEAARSRLKAISRVFDWAMGASIQGITRNPTRDVKYPKAKAGGFHMWSTAEVAQYVAHHPVGTKARLALAMLLFTGQRKSDVVVLGPQHVHNGELHFTQQKNAGRNPVTLTLPILKELEEVIEATPTGPTTFLVTEWGKPFSRAGFGARMRKWCDEAGLPECTSHGLRKVAATILAENGATEHELMAICGWRDIRQAQLYTRGARQKLLAARAMPLIVARNATK